LITLTAATVGTGIAILYFSLGATVYVLNGSPVCIEKAKISVVGDEADVLDLPPSSLTSRKLRPSSDSSIQVSVLMCNQVLIDERLNAYVGSSLSSTVYVIISPDFRVVGVQTE
jgi:hypothetical protein